MIKIPTKVMELLQILNKVKDQQLAQVVVEVVMDL